MSLRDWNPPRHTPALRLVLQGVLAAALLSGLVGLPEARGDYIAEVQEGGRKGYMYIGKRCIKRQGLSGWMYGDLVIRDDKDCMYLIERAKGQDVGALALATKRHIFEGAPAPEVEIEKPPEERRSTEDSLSETGEQPRLAVVPQYDTRIVPYSMVESRRREVAGIVKPLRDTTEAHLNDPGQSPQSRRGMLAYIAMVDAYMMGQPSFTNTGETAVIAGRECTKYRVRLAPIFQLDVWTTTDLGPGYTAGHMFAKPYNFHRGGVRPMEVLGEIPGFPLKLQGEYRNVQGRGMISIEYEVLSLTETDFDEKEFDPRPGSRVYTGKLPGFGER